MPAQIDRTSSIETAPVVLDALTVQGTYRSRRTEVITDTAGVPIAEMTFVPTLLIGRDIDAQRHVIPLPVSERMRIINEAADLVANTTIAGLTFDEYATLAARVSGLPVSITTPGAAAVADQCRAAMASIRAAQPSAAALDWQEDRTRRGGAVWARKGRVYGVHASGNAVGLFGFWIEALLLGYRVAIRPSRREPFTAHRMVLALRAAGLRPADVIYLPTDYAGADEILRSTDLSMVYGGQDVVDKYSDDPTIFVNGPGRSKTIITADMDWHDYLDTIVDSVSHHGGMACVNTTAVLYEGDPRELADAVAQRLSTIKPLPPHDPDAKLPTQPIDRARAIADVLALRAVGTIPLLGADQVVADLDGANAALRPAVHLLPKPDLATLNTELPFPCEWIAPWSRSDGISPLRNSLVVNAITKDPDLIDALIDEPTITNVYSGHRPTHYTAPHIPHDGYPADFLMRNKGFIRD
ncbi:aldehyde dehydrogenase family protein [Mycolicibacterium llatzerense]|uniref:aldehyde dehydrogenase family protein n=1 Tax=Mycolicibacterium llatzerense TaxID=280871 RepID=UPI0021B63EAD|nr:aldehyde dehydrogenase family protein [Mycolicibacterium llatzerense]MCT7362757.1 aldehyde dehydrogenase [Mycolicibacterium llatzerense]